MPKTTTGPRRVKPAVNAKAYRERRKRAAEDVPEVIELSLATHKGRLRGEGRRGDGSKKIVVPQTKEFGNTAGDRAWFEAAKEAGFIVPIPADEMNAPEGSSWQYTGPLVARADFWTWNGTRRCTGFSYMRDTDGHYIVGDGYFALKRPCTRPPILGGIVCVAHGGGIERVKRAAQERLLGAADSVIGALITIALDTKADEKARVQAINSVLDRCQIKGIDTVQVDIPAYRQVIAEAFPKWGEGEEEDDD